MGGSSPPPALYQIGACWGVRVFQGTIPAEARSMIVALARTWSAPEIYVGCSGNFTIERSLEGLGGRLHGNDVSIYTCTLGRYLAGEPCGVTLRPESAAQLDWMAGSLDDGAGTVAAMMLGTRFLNSVGRDHAYHSRLVQAYREQWPRLMDVTRAKVEATTLRLASFAAQDVVDWLPTVPRDAPVCSFPPFWGGGYETMWAPLEKHLDWPRPDYEVLSEDAVSGLLEKIADRPHWCLGTKERWEPLEPHLRGLIQLTPRSVPMWMYGSGGGARVVQPRQVVTPVTAPRLVQGATAAGPLRLHPLTMGQFNALRSQYLNPHIPPGQALLPVGVSAGGFLVGVFAVSPSSFARDGLYLLSDFPVAPTSYRHLAKLVVAAALSTEARQLAERCLSRRLHTIGTTAFSQHPESMKYRGLLRLTKRTETEDHPHWRWQLQYEAELGQWSLQEGWELWERRWANAAGKAARPC